MTTDTYDLLVSACRQVGLSPARAHLIREHSNTVYLLPDERTVARISHNDHHGLRAAASVAITRWLADHEIPVTEPRVDHPVDIDHATITFWHYYPQPENQPAPPPAPLGAILARLHALPEPPFDLPAYPPLAGLTANLHDPSSARALTDDDRAWLLDRARHLTTEFHTLDSHLGIGMVHGDAYPGNTLWGPNGSVLLGDWDEISRAPRELDLVNTLQGARFGTPAHHIDAFVDAYGWDVRTWPGFALLHEMRDLHTLTAYVRQAGHGNTAARHELDNRLRSLRDPRYADSRWNTLG